MNNKYVIGLLTAIFLTPFAIAENNINNINDTNLSITYRVDVDQDYGFYRVRDISTRNPAPYQNNTLSINVGDTVIWRNDATPDVPLTIISKENLWENRSGYLRWNYQRFNYTFNESGTYDVYIKEYPREEHQIIVVKPLEIPIVTIESTPTEVFEGRVTPTEIPTEIIPIETAPKIRGLTVVWLLLILVGLIIFVIYKIKRKN